MNDIKAHNVVHVEHESPLRKQPAEIALGWPSMVVPYIDDTSQKWSSSTESLSTSLVAKNFNYSRCHEGNPEDAWKPNADFVYQDGTITSAFYDYTHAENILSNVH